jgi:hypothetical protein
VVVYNDLSGRTYDDSVFIDTRTGRVHDGTPIVLPTPAPITRHEELWD